ncbi:MAG TPA: DUF4226 domain-containing protein [Mycobacterium sp.]|nr:DUF4226 domain-containing protein [Mycobacterium sp.]
MVEQSGQSIAALQRGGQALADRHAELVDADRLLADAVTTAHTTTVEALAALDRIEGEIETAVAGHLTEDGPAAAHELQRFLIAKQREIIAVVTEARDRAQAKATAVRELADAYRSANPPASG